MYAEDGVAASSVTASLLFRAHSRPVRGEYGGEKALLYSVVEDFIANFGVDGKAVGQRATLVCHPECRIQHQPGKENNCVACWAADAGLGDTRQQGAFLGGLR